jgi:hypothetical protein
METCFLGCAMQNAGVSIAAVAAWQKIRSATPRIGKWMGVGESGTPTIAYKNPVGVDENFWTWPLAGAVHDTREMSSMVPPGGHALAGRDVKTALLAAGNFQASAKALEALE